PDGPEGEARVAAHLASCDAELIIGLGGDNSLTYAMAKARWANAMSTAGLVTLDAHHDVRDGVSNGSPVRRLIEAGLDPICIAQIGI
ncbi:arginase family protein, partial [Enterococcus faecalis]|uniref:arginase family protein n=1 Tax=Enterococcus faecalis TaxID=1351 RepID=UPI004039F444